MGHDDEYTRVAAGDESADQLLGEKGHPITRAAYKKRSMFVSLAIGALIGAALTFLVSILFAPRSTIVSRPTASSAPQVFTSTGVDSATQVLTSMTATDAVKEIATSTAAPVTVVFQEERPQNDGYHVVDDGTILDCGDNFIAAREKGCIFDVMMQDWVPPACYDEGLSERYLARGNWTWWADPDATQQLTLDQMRKGEHSVIYVIQDYHRQHCIFAWEKMVRALRNDWPVIEELISYDHVMHCRHSTLSKQSESVRGVRAPVAFSRCGYYRDWMGHFPENSLSSSE